MPDSEETSYTTFISIIGVIVFLISAVCLAPRIYQRILAEYTAWRREFQESILASVESAFERRGIPVHYRSDEQYQSAGPIVHIHNEVPRTAPPSPLQPIHVNLARRPHSH